MFIAAACNNSDSDTPTSDFTGNSHQPKELSLSASQQQMVQPLNRFAMRLFRQDAADQDHSLVMSPIGTAMTLAMLANGAEGDTHAEIVYALGLSDKDDASFNSLFERYMEQTQDDSPMKIANSVIVNKAYALKKDYESAMQKCYRAQTASLDFSNPSALQVVNHWCSTHTDGLIPSIVSELDQSVVLCLLNAVCFEALWDEPFNADASMLCSFHGETDRELRMMTRTSPTDYYETSAYKAIRLPMQQGIYNVTFVLPVGETELGGLLSTFDGDDISKISFESRLVDMRLPVFKTEATADLAELLKRVGILSAFDAGKAQFPKMVMKSEGLFVSLMRQNAAIGINEEGVKAGSASIAEMSLSANPETAETATFFADHPFLYFITDRQSGTIFFIGQFCGD